MPEKVGNTHIYTVKEVCTILDRSYPTVNRLLDDGKIKFSNLGAQRIIERKDLAEYLHEIHLPEDIIEYRLGIKSPKNGAVINKKSPVA